MYKSATQLEGVTIISAHSPHKKLSLKRAGLVGGSKRRKKRSKENWWTKKDAGVFPKRAVIYRRSRQLRLLLTFVLKRAIHVRSN